MALEYVAFSGDGTQWPGFSGHCTKVLAVRQASPRLEAAGSPSSCQQSHSLPRPTVGQERGWASGWMQVQWPRRASGTEGDGAGMAFQDGGQPQEPGPFRVVSNAIWLRLKIEAWGKVATAWDKVEGWREFVDRSSSHSFDERVALGTQLEAAMALGTVLPSLIRSFIHGFIHTATQPPARRPLVHRFHSQVKCPEAASPGELAWSPLKDSEGGQRLPVPAPLGRLLAGPQLPS